MAVVNAASLGRSLSYINWLGPAITTIQWRHFSKSLGDLSNLWGSQST